MRKFILYVTMMSMLVCFISCNHIPDEDVTDLMHTSDTTTLCESTETTRLGDTESEHISFRKGDIIEVSMLVKNEELTPYAKIVGGYHVQDSLGGWGENDSLMFGPSYIIIDVANNYDATLPIVDFGQSITITLFDEIYEITSYELYDSDGNSMGNYSINDIPAIPSDVYYTFHLFSKNGQEIDGMRETFQFGVFYKVRID